MLGNDIVSIRSEANIRSFQRRRYIEICFLPREIELIESSDSVMPFILWSAKESAYKSFVKFGYRDRFNPADFSCFKLNMDKSKMSVKGTVECNNSYVAFISKLTENYVHTICGNCDELEYVAQFVVQIDPKDIPDSARLIRESLCRRISKEIKIPLKSLSIKNQDITGIPYLFNNNRKFDMLDISLSHDDQFLAYCFNQPDEFLKSNLRLNSRC